MSEREDVLASIAHTISSYRQDELAEPSLVHVDRWASQFSAATQLPFLREFDHVIRQTFFDGEVRQNVLEQACLESEACGSGPDCVLGEGEHPADSEGWAEPERDD